jgi:hypothetical protein
LLSLAIAVSFGLASIFGATLMMNMDGDGVMKDCPIMAGGSGICDMNAAAHIKGWQELFYATFEKSGLMVLLSIFALIFSGFFLLRIFRNLNALKLIPIRWDQSRKKRQSDNFQNYIFEVIGSGIVHKRE